MKKASEGPAGFMKLEFGLGSNVRALSQPSSSYALAAHPETLPGRR